MENKKMTIFYKKRNLEIDKLCTGEQDLKTYARLDKEDAEMIFGYLVLDYDEQIFNNDKQFELIEENNEIKISMKEEYKEILQKYM